MIFITQIFVSKNVFLTVKSVFLLS